MDRGAWWATVHGVAKSQTWLSSCCAKLPPGCNTEVVWGRLAAHFQEATGQNRPGVLVGVLGLKTAALAAKVQWHVPLKRSTKWPFSNSWMSHEHLTKTFNLYHLIAHLINHPGERRKPQVFPGTQHRATMHAQGWMVICALPAPWVGPRPQAAGRHHLVRVGPRRPTNDPSQGHSFSSLLLPRDTDLPYAPHLSCLPFTSQPASYSALPEDPI